MNTQPELAEELKVLGEELALHRIRKAATTEAAARAVHRAWRDGMQQQRRFVAAERQLWETLTREDRLLDAAIAREVADALCTLAQQERETALQHQLSRLQEALAFAASVIKSGEPWTAHCEEIIGAALQGGRSTRT